MTSKTLYICAMLFIPLWLYPQCEPRRILFSEINYEQDSINPFTVHLTLKVIDKMHCSFAMENATIIWGDGTYNTIPLIDTASVTFKDSLLSLLKTYKGTHTYTTLPADSIVTLGWSSFGVIYWVGNTYDDPENISVATQASVNFKQLSFTTGVKSPVFTSPMFVGGTILQPFDFDPMIQGDSSFEYSIGLVPPYSYLNAHGSIYPLDEWPVHPQNHYYVTPNNGFLHWDIPLGSGGYMITYLVYFSKGGKLLGAITRNMILDIQDTITTSLHSLQENSLEISPNPATTQLTLTLSDVTSNTTLQLFTIQGQQITAPQNVTQQYTQIDVSNLPAGLYFAVLQNSPLSLGEGAGVRSVRRFVKE